MMDFFIELSNHQWANNLTLFFFVPLLLTVNCYITQWAIRKNPRPFAIGGALGTFACFLAARLILWQIPNAFFQSVLPLATYLFAQAVFMGTRTRKEIPLAFKGLAFTMATDGLAMLIAYALFGDALNDGTAGFVWTDSRAIAILTACVPSLTSYCLLATLLNLIRKKWVFSKWIFAVQIGGLVLIILLIIFQPVSKKVLPHYTEGGLLMGNVLFLVFVPILLTIIASYAYQYQSARREAAANAQLRQQQRLQEALLLQQRGYRHNLTNMLYGIEGVIATGDMAQIRAYHHDLVQKYQQIANDNVIAVQQVPSPSVRGFLLRHMEAVSQAGIPLHLFVEDVAAWCRLPQAELCALLGVLLDNAREAAQEAQAPFLSVEIRGEDSGLEILIRNTYAMQPALDEHLKGQGTSSKGESRGVGLPSLFQMLEKHRAVQFHITRSCQYVVQHLLLPAGDGAL